MNGFILHFWKSLISSLREDSWILLLISDSFCCIITCSVTSGKTSVQPWVINVSVCGRLMGFPGCGNFSAKSRIVGHPPVEL